jgi:hypothetical protein
VVVRGDGRGSAARGHELALWLPAPDGEIRAVPALHALPTPPDHAPTPAPAPHLHAVPDPPPAEPATVGVLRAPARRSSSPGGPGEETQTVATPPIAALWQDVTHRPGARPPVSRRADGPTHPRPVGPPRRTSRAPADRGPSARAAAAPDRPRDPTARTATPGGGGPHDPARTTARAGGAPSIERGSRPRPAGPPVPAGRPAPVGGGLPAAPPPTAGHRPAIPADVLARLRPASTLPKPPPKQQPPAGPATEG